jgi:hypothetical protein
MLSSSIVLAIGQISVHELPLIDVTQATSRPQVTPFTPAEPSTLVLGLIGVGLIAAYAVITRSLQANREAQSQRILKPVNAGGRRKAA